jgi:hypothetical protein
MHRQLHLDASRSLLQNNQTHIKIAIAGEAGIPDPYRNGRRWLVFKSKKIQRT